MGVPMETKPLHDPDGGYGWVITAASFVSLAVVNGLRCSFSLLYVEFSQVFDESKATLGWIGSLNIALCNGIGLLAGKLVTRYGCRPVAIFGSLLAASGYVGSAFVNTVPMLYLTYGILAGSGLGILMLPAFVLVQQYFTKRRALAGGMASLGFAFGNVIIPPAVNFFLQLFGWRGTLILLGGISLQGLIPAFLFRPPPPRMSKFSSKKSLDCESEDDNNAGKHGILAYLHHSWKTSVLRDHYFLLCATGTFLMNFGMFTFITHCASRASHYNMAPNDIMFLLPILGVCDVLSRIVFSVVANLNCCTRIAQYGAGIFCGGIVIMASSFTKNFISLAVFTGLFGICSGCYLCIQQTVLSDLLGIERIAEAQGMQSLFIGLALVHAIPFAGWLFDISHDYDIPFQVNGSLMVLGGLIVMVIILIKFHRKEPTGPDYIREDTVTGTFANESKAAPPMNLKFPIYRPSISSFGSTRSLNITLANGLLHHKSLECLRRVHSANFNLANGKPWTGSREKINADESRISLIENDLNDQELV